MISKYRVYLSLTIILTMSFILSCTSYLDSPLVVYKSPEFRPEHFKNSQIAVLPPATGNAAYENTALIVLEGLLKKDYKTFKLIHPEQTLKFIREKNLGDKLKKVYALYGDAEDNVLFASAIGKSLNAEYTLYSKITNVVFTGERVIDTELMTRYNREYNSVEEFELLNTFSLYPNPAHHTLNIVFNSAFKGDIYLTDMIGRNIDIRNNISIPDKNTIAIDISKLAPGVYFINVETDNNIAKRKFIKH